MIRLNKYLSEAGVCSRRTADEWIEAGKVKVNGEVALLGTKVTEDDEVTVGGKVITLDNPFKLVAFYKPTGYACTSYEWDKTGIFKNFPLEEDLKYIGRLDKDSEGLLLLTNDGDLCNEISKARNEHEKEYIVKVNRTITEDFLKGMADGVRIHDSNKEQWVVTKPCVVKKTDDNTFTIILTQGINRQIRKMCKSFDYNVVNLKRVRVVNVELGKMKPGEIRNVTEDELTVLKTRISKSHAERINEVIDKSDLVAAREKRRKTSQKKSIDEDDYETIKSSKRRKSNG